MPAPLGKTPTKKMPRIEVYGLEDSQATRGAIRFFRERRIVATFVDLRKKALTIAEVRRFVDAIGLESLLERSAAAPAGTDAPATANAGALAATIHANPNILRLPLVRYGERVTAGRAEPTWRDWLAPS